MRTSAWKFGIATLIVLLSISLAHASSVEGAFERTFQVNGHADLEIFTRSGDVIVRGGPAGTVAVSGKIHVGEAWHLYRAGMSAEDILRALTHRTLAPGEPADLVVLGGNPLENLGALGDLRLVIHGGRRFR